MRSITADILRREGYTVVEASDGFEALERLKEGRYNLLFTDVVLPKGLSGIDVAVKAEILHPGLEGAVHHRIRAQRSDVLRPRRRSAQRDSEALSPPGVVGEDSRHPGRLTSPSHGRANSEKEPRVRSSDAASARIDDSPFVGADASIIDPIFERFVL